MGTVVHHHQQVLVVIFLCRVANSATLTDGQNMTQSVVRRFSMTIKTPGFQARIYGRDCVGAKKT